DNVSSDFKPVVNNNFNVNKKDVTFFPGLYSGELFCASDNVFFKMNFDSTLNTLQYVPVFAMKDKTHYYNGISYDSTTGTIFLRTLNEGILQLRLTKTTTINTNGLLNREIGSKNAINYAVCATT